MSKAPVPVRPVLIQADTTQCVIAVGKRQITVGRRPIASSQSNSISHKLVALSPDIRKLEPTFRSHFFIFLLILVGLVVLIAGPLVAGLSEKGIGAGLLGLLAVAGGATWLTYELLYRPRLVFDKSAGQLYQDPAGKMRPKPLADIIAVQLNDGMPFVNEDKRSAPEWISSIDRMTGNYGSDIKVVRTFEVNLILDDHRGGIHSVDEEKARELEEAGMVSVSRYLQKSQHDQRRMSLFCHSVEAAARQAAQELADFLEVPLAVQILGPADAGQLLSWLGGGRSG